MSISSNSLEMTATIIDKADESAATTSAESKVNMENAYFYSQDHIDQLNTEILDLKNNINILNQDNINANALKKSTTISIQTSNISLTDIKNRLSNAANFQVENNKIYKITPYFSNSTSHIIGLKFLSTNNEVKKIGETAVGESTKAGIPYAGGVVELYKDEFIIKIEKMIFDKTIGCVGYLLIFTISNGIGNTRDILIANPDIMANSDSTEFKEHIAKIRASKKTFWISDKKHHITTHQNMLKEVDRYGISLARIENIAENNEVKGLLVRKNKRSAFIDGDGEVGTSLPYYNWANNEPNNVNEKFIEILNNGEWNDINGKENYAVYQMVVPVQEAMVMGSKSITGFKDFCELDIISSEKYSQDTASKERDEDSLLSTASQISDAQDTIDGIQPRIDSNNILITGNKKSILKKRETIEDINRVNIEAKNKLEEISGFTNMNNKVSSFFNNIFSYNKINMTEGYADSNYLTLRRKLHGDTIAANNDLNNYYEKLQNSEHVNYMLELLGQRDNIASDVLMDYVINNDDNEGSNLGKVYEKLKQENLDKQRKIKINDYYSKTYIEYSHILKTIIFLICTMIPFLFLSKYEIISKNISLSIVTVILFLGFLYILYRLYLLYMKDNINFDKNRIPYDRQAANLINDNKIKKKPGLSG